jgi:hypothetical protein
LLEPERVEAGKLFEHYGELVAVCYYHGLHVQLEAEATEVPVEPYAPLGEEQAQGWDYLACPSWDWEAQWVLWVGLHPWVDWGVGELERGVQRPRQPAPEAPEAELLGIHLKLVAHAGVLPYCVGAVLPEDEEAHPCDS